MMQDNDIELKSEELQDIIGKKPTWIIRYGITVIFIIVGIFILLSFILRFPYTITSRVIITTKVPPLSIKAKLSGRVFLFVKDNEDVEKGAIIGCIENAAVVSDVLYAKNEVKKIKAAYSLQPDFSEKYKYNNKELKLGQLQLYYFNLIQAIETERQYRALDQTKNQLKLLSQQFEYYRKIEQNRKTQEAYNKEDQKIAQNKLKMDSTLREQQVIAQLDYDNSKRNYLQTRLGIENSNVISINNQIELSTLQAQIMQLRASGLERDRGLHVAIEEAIKVLEEKIEDWEKTYLFIAPNPGKVSLVSIWNDNQLVDLDQEVVKIVPSMNSLYCKALVPIQGSGRLSTKQKVIIRLDNYPYNEYGILRGEVQFIAPVPVDGSYTVTIALPKGLETTYKKKLPFRQEMQGTGEIITSNVSIMARIFNQLNSIFDKTRGLTDER